MSYTMPWAKAIDEMRDRYGDSNLTYEGETRTVSQWAVHLDLMETTMYTRLHKYNRGDICLASVFMPNRARKPVLA